MVYPLEVFLFVAFIYFVMCFAVEIIANVAAKKLSAQNDPYKRAAKRSLLFWRRQKLLALS